MNPNSAIKKYYVGVAVLAVFMVGALVYAVGQAGAAKTDRETNKAVEKLYDKLGYGSSVPASLAAVGITDAPSTVRYTKLSTSEYKVCVDYKQASGIFDAGWSSLLGGAFAGSTGNTQSDTSSGYFNSSVEFRHKKGQNCQTVKPYTYNYDDDSSSSSYFDSNSSPDSSLSASDPACSTFSTDLNVNGYAVVSRVDTVTKTIYFDSTGQYVYDGSKLPVIASKQYDSSTLICDGSTLEPNTYKKTDITKVKAGSNITIYMKNSGDATLSRIDTL